MAYRWMGKWKVSLPSASLSITSMPLPTVRRPMPFHGDVAGDSDADLKSELNDYCYLGA